MKTGKTAVSIALGGVFAVSLGVAPVAGAAENPFSMHSLEKGYLVADAKGAEGKCGGMKMRDGKCGMMMMDANGDGKVSKEEFTKAHEGMFADMDKNKDGMVDESEMGKMRHGKCGGMKSKEGKCGGMK